MSLRLAIWDMDGTLVDSRDIIHTAMVRAFTSQGLEPPPFEATRRLVGLSLETVIRALAPALEGQALHDLVEAYRHAFLSRRTEPDHVEPLYEGARETLDRLLAGGWVLGVATGKARRGVDAIFEMHPGLKASFDTVWCADDGPGKPHPFMVEEAMKAVGAAASRTLIIGDAVHDIAMGRAAGITTYGVSWGFGRAEELRDAGAHEIHHDFMTLRASLDRFCAAGEGGA